MTFPLNNNKIIINVNVKRALSASDSAQVKRGYLHSSALMINELAEFLVLLEMLIS